jgi:signal transduction histidine kinase
VGAKRWRRKIRGARLSLKRQFLIGSLIVLVLGAAGIGVWVSRQIEDEVVQRSAATTALYVDSLVEPALQSLATEVSISPEDRNQLEWLFADTPLGREVLLFRVWDREGRIVFSTEPKQTGTEPSLDPEFEAALDGRVQAHVGGAEGDAALEKASSEQSLLEIYSPVRGRGTNDVIGVAEFYYSLAALRGDISQAQRESWILLAGVTALIYIVLAAFVNRASDTIDVQRGELRRQVATLQGLLKQNQELHTRVRSAAGRTVALNERLLRRLSADLHDGPAQELSLAILRLDNLSSALDRVHGELNIAGEIASIQDLLRQALQELRSTSSGILLPQLATLSVGELVDHAARGYRRRSGKIAQISTSDLPLQASLPTKIALYRIIQEALTNVSRHASDAAVTIRVTASDRWLHIEVSDNGPGFVTDTSTISGNQLGLEGMRERTESLGGNFHVRSAPGSGTCVAAALPLWEVDDELGVPDGRVTAHRHR